MSRPRPPHDDPARQYADRRRHERHAAASARPRPSRAVARFDSRVRRLAGPFRRSLLTEGASARRRSLRTKCLRRHAVPASEGTVKRGWLRVAQQIGHFGNRQRRPTQIQLRRVPSRIVAQGVERRPTAREAALERARGRRALEKRSSWNSARSRDGRTARASRRICFTTRSSSCGRSVSSDIGKGDDVSDILPAIFFGRGNPMNALLENAYTEAWRRIGHADHRPYQP